MTPLAGDRSKAHPGGLGRFCHAHAEAGQWRQAVDRALEALGAVPAGASLGFCYVADHFAGDFHAIVERLRACTGGVCWVGTVGVGICATGIEYHDRPAIALMLCDVPRESFAPLAIDADGGIASGAGRWSQDSNAGPPFAVIHADPRTEGLARTLERASRSLDDAFLVGGLSSSRTQYAQVAGEVFDAPVSGVVFSPEVAVATRLTQGCTPIGERHRVTACRDNIIERLDGRPALDVFREDVGDLLARDLQRAGNYILAGLPVPGSDTGDYVARHVVGAEPGKRLLAIAERVQPGDSIFFCRRDPNSAYEDLLAMLERIRPAPGQTVRGALYFSCLGRGEAQFGPDSRELRAIQQGLGEVPLVGFFGNGEISGGRLYGYTGVLVLFL